jgi:hypothetical protein
MKFQVLDIIPHLKTAGATEPDAAAVVSAHHAHHRSHHVYAH